MTLTPEIMRTDPTGNRIEPGALDQDITAMDEAQLDKYVRLGFLDKWDLSFLPRPFWTQTFSVKGGQGPHDVPTPGDFFAGLYTTINAWQKGKFSYKASNGPDYKIDPEYRNRLENILDRILDECRAVKGKLKKEHLMLAQGAVEALSNIRFSEGPNSPEEQFGQALEKAGKLPIFEALELADSLQYPPINSNALFRKVITLKEDPRYSRIDYQFFNA
jgi:hypothetical protein